MEPDETPTEMPMVESILCFLVELASREQAVDRIS